MKFLIDIRNATSGIVFFSLEKNNSCSRLYTFCGWDLEFQRWITCLFFKNIPALIISLYMKLRHSSCMLICLLFPFSTIIRILGIMDSIILLLQPDGKINSRWSMWKVWNYFFFNEGCKQHKLAFDNLSSLFLCNMICLVIGENVT